MLPNPLDSILPVADFSGASPTFFIIWHDVLHLLRIVVED